jgi:hypothetical protein
MIPRQGHHPDRLARVDDRASRIDPAGAPLLRARQGTRTDLTSVSADTKVTETGRTRELAAAKFSVSEAAVNQRPQSCIANTTIVLIVFQCQRHNPLVPLVALDEPPTHLGGTI